MYGQIHCVIRELVQTKFGEEAWEMILRKSGLDQHNSFLMFTRYDDVSTFSLVGAVSDTLGVSVETVLEIFGEFFFDYCLRHGYDKMLRTLGSDIKSFIQNLDSLHSLLALSYKGINAPSFRCEDGPGGSLILHYYSGRPGLYPIVKGVLKAVARDLFQQSVEMTIIEQNKEDIGCNQSQEHTAFRVDLRMDSPTGGPVTPDLVETRGLVKFSPDSVLLKATDFCSAFPYHIIFDKDLRIRQCGVLVQKHSSVTLREGTPLTQAFSIVHPRMVLSVDNIRKFINAVFLLALSPEQNGKKTIILKGQMIWISDTQHMIFIGSPRLTSLNELMEMNVYLADIPLYDVTRELVLLNQQRIAEIDIAKRLDETTAELKKTSVALEKEKHKTETLLHQMLPRRVAKALTNGEKVEAEKFDQVTVLFSDIVTFTNIAAACTPMDIVNMLNEMYQRFDQRTSQHNVYKVETIGDAYMVVSGVPDRTAMHAQPVANFALDMIEDAGLVKSPATGLPLQIRVGVHTGPVVAGVVGVKMPRYCLFGDTVNTASRMESHGVPGRIHLSPTAYKALRGWGYAFKERGEMEVKGKGRMSTYFLMGHLHRRLADPSDPYSDLDVRQDSSEAAQNDDVTHTTADVLTQQHTQTMTSGFSTTEAHVISLIAPESGDVKSGQVAPHGSMTSLATPPSVTDSADGFVSRSESPTIGRIEPQSSKPDGSPCRSETVKTSPVRPSNISADHETRRLSQTCSTASHPSHVTSQTLPGAGTSVMMTSEGRSHSPCAGHTTIPAEHTSHTTQHTSHTTQHTTLPAKPTPLPAEHTTLQTEHTSHTTTSSTSSDVTTDTPHNSEPTSATDPAPHFSPDSPLGHVVGRSSPRNDQCVYVNGSFKGAYGPQVRGQSQTHQESAGAKGGSLTNHGNDPSKNNTSNNDNSTNNDNSNTNNITNDDNNTSTVTNNDSRSNNVTNADTDNSRGSITNSTNNDNNHTTIATTNNTTTNNNNHHPTSAVNNPPELKPTSPPSQPPEGSPNLSRSETYPGVHTTTAERDSNPGPVSASHGDLHRLQARGKEKKRRKHRSKLCSVT